MNHRAGHHHVVPILLDLEHGGDNKIVFGVSGEAGVVLEGIEVVED
jgi:hypothetical protein